ncbi:MAG: flavodoxin family protein [Candidatus Omnitrophica bacterium]|nr:flavodoxin family protein [Candidatus Omnitrophota bacterium]
MKKILIISGSPKTDGNTDIAVKWLTDAISKSRAHIEIIKTSKLNYKSLGCISCRACQSRQEYGCVIKDDVQDVLKKTIDADTIIFATPLYFFGCSAQTKLIFDKWFSLYKWDNTTNTMKTPLQGKTLAVIATAYEDIGLDALEKPFKLTAEYSNMKFLSLLIKNAGVSGQIKKLEDAEEKIASFAFNLLSF